MIRGNVSRRSTRHWVDALLLGSPLVAQFWSRYGGRTKKAWCLALHRLGLLTPSSFVLWICTRRCNFSCAFCEARAGAAAPDELTTEEAKALIDDIAGIGARRLLISGGEPLLRADLPVLLEHSLKRSVTPALLSNGSLVSSRWEEIRHFRYFLFMTSIDGPRGIHDRLRRAGSFDRAMAALENFASIGVRTRVVKTIVHPANLASLPELAECLESSAATDWQLAPVIEVGRARNQSAYQLSGQDWQRLIDFVEGQGGRNGLNVELAHPCAHVHALTGRLGPRPVFCGAGLTRCAVMPNGDVLACGQAYDLVAPEGNIRRTPLRQIWRNVFNQHRRFAQPPECCGCRHWRACQGACWAQRQTGGECLKAVLPVNSKTGE